MPSISEYEYPLEIIRPIEHIINQFETDFTLILRPCDSPTFTITAQTEILKTYLDVLSPYVPKKYINMRRKFPKWYICLSFPRAMSKNALLHSITFSHEVLHLKDYIEGISTDISNQISIPSEKLDKIVKSSLNATVPGYESMLVPRTYSEFYSEDVIKSAIMQQCTDIIAAWISELVADLVAVRLFGPTYFFASAQHSLSLGVIDSNSNSHPNSRLRLRLMLRELRDLGYLRNRKNNTDIVDVLKLWSDFVKSKKATSVEPIYSLVSSAISRSQSYFTSKIRSITRGKDYTASRFHREVWELVTLINNGIPPSELVDYKNNLISSPTLVACPPKRSPVVMLDWN